MATALKFPDRLELNVNVTPVIIAVSTGDRVNRQNGASNPCDTGNGSKYIVQL
jgi:hypothetical protein